jgi:ribulose-phosphate 3-epimerase
VHQEASIHLDRTLHMIQNEGARAGVVINPATPVAAISEVLDVADYVLVMSVNPGFGAQKFIPNSLHKVRDLARIKRERGLQFHIEIDGGVSLENVSAVVQAGVEWVVSGSAIFHTVKPGATFEEMQQAARGASAVRV